MTIAAAYVQITNAKRNTTVLYGPFPTSDAARRASFFYWDEATFETRRTRGSGEGVFSFDVYDAVEIEALISDPLSFGHKKASVKPAKALKRDTHWSRFTSPNFDDVYFRQIFQACFHREPKLTQE